MSTPHTPTPWHVDGRGNFGGTLWSIKGAGQNPGLPEPCQSVAIIQTRADVAYALRAINNYEQTKDALKRVLELSDPLNVAYNPARIHALALEALNRLDTYDTPTNPT